MFFFNFDNCLIFTNYLSINWPKVIHFYQGFLFQKPQKPTERKKRKKREKREKKGSEKKNDFFLYFCLKIKISSVFYIKK